MDCFVFVIWHAKSILVLRHMKKTYLKPPTWLRYTSSTPISYAICLDLGAYSHLPITFMLSFEVQPELFDLEQVDTNGVNLHKNK